MSEVRTTSNIVADLLRLVIDGEWSGEFNTSCHCHPTFVPACPECMVLRRDPHASTMAYNEHKPDCSRKALIVEARAFLNAENELAEERGDEGVYVP